MDVQYEELQQPIRPKDHIDEIRSALPNKYSPLQQSGDGLQSVDLAEVNSRFAAVLDALLSSAGNELHDQDPKIQSHRDESIAASEIQVESNLAAGPTEKEQLIKARRGQGRFRENVERFEASCRVTGVSDSQFLIASHIKPWRHASNRERLDGENGLLLTPNIDRLFDRGFISFGDGGELLIATVADRDCLARLGIPDDVVQCGTFTDGQRAYLEYHRQNVWLGK